MKKLFIIGNGFDCYGHLMNTQYIDFKKYLENRFPNRDEEFDGILESTMMPDGGEEYDMDEVVGALIKTLDECTKPSWSNLEGCLANEFLDNIRWNNEWCFSETNIEDDDVFHSVYENEDLSNSLIGAYIILEKLFEDWVRIELTNIDYASIKKLKLKPSFRKAMFLNFNYTRTLESVYHVPLEKVCHIHGDAYDKYSKIYFGHGDDTEFKEDVNYIGIEESFSHLKRSLRKNTNEALENNYKFFEEMKNVSKIYSYGFSFSEVDMIYIQEICKQIEPSKIKWYFNTYDWNNNRSYVDTIRQLGFQVKKCYLW